MFRDEEWYFLKFKTLRTRSETFLKVRDEKRTYYSLGMKNKHLIKFRDQNNILSLLLLLLINLLVTMGDGGFEF